MSSVLPDPELIGQLLKKAVSHGGEYADVFAEDRASVSLVLEDGKLEKVVSGTETGVGIRLISNLKTSYAFCNDLSASALMSSASGVSAAASGSPTGVSLDLSVRRPSAIQKMDIPPDSVPIEKKIELIRRADRAARTFDKRIRQVTVIYRDTVQQVLIGGTDGRLCCDDRVYVTAVIQVIAADGQLIQTGYESAGGLLGFELFNYTDIEELSLKAASRAIKMLSARKSPGGRMPVVISSSAGGTMIHEAIGHGLEADLAHQGFSVFSGKVGQQVASRLVTVIDDATLLNKRGSFGFDDEGSPAQRTLLVEEGILRTYMYDRLSSMKNHTVSTGNGRRESARHRPIPRMTNTFIASGTTPPEAIVASLDHGLLVTKMGGGQVNTVTGDFVFDVQEGFLIEKGEAGELVREATLTGNGPTVLLSIDMVGADLGFSIGTCGKDAQGVPVSDAMPTVRIPELVVGGECS